MIKLIKKFQEGGTAYRASYSLPEIKVTDKQPEWFKYLNDYDKARLKSGQINTETAKSIAQKRATGTSQYMQDVNKLSWIPNSAMAVAGGMSLIGNPVAVDVLGNAALATDIVEASDMKQAIKENAPYLLLSGISPFFKIGKFFGLGTKGVKVAGETTGKAVKIAAKEVKKAGKNTVAGFREGMGKPPKQKVSEPNNSTTTIEKFEKWPKKWFKEKKVITTPEITGTPAEPDKLFDPVSKTYKDVPEGVKKKGLVKKLPDGREVKKLPKQRYETSSWYKIDGGDVVTKEELDGKMQTFERFVYPDNTIYGDFLKGSFKKGKAATETIPASKVEKEVLRPWVKKAGWITGLTTAGITIPHIVNSIKSENSSQENVPLQSTENQKQQSNNYYQKNISELNPKLFDLN